MARRLTHAKSSLGNAEICARTIGGPSKKVAKTMRAIAGLVCCGRGWRCISLGDALEQKSCAVFRYVEADFQISMLAIDFGRSGEKREIGLLDSEPTLRIIALDQFAAVAGGGVSVLAIRCSRSRALFSGMLKRISRSACWRLISGGAAKSGRSDCSIRSQRCGSS